MPHILAPPYFAVIFTSQLAPDAPGYESVAREMEELVAQQEGFLGFDSARGAQGFGITVSYWKTLESIEAWKVREEHRAAKAKASTWYQHYQIRVAKVEADSLRARA